MVLQPPVRHRNKNSYREYMTLFSGIQRDRTGHLILIRSDNPIPSPAAHVKAILRMHPKLLMEPSSLTVLGNFLKVGYIFHP